MTIPSHKISFSQWQRDQMMRGFGDVIDSGQVILGDRTKEFEERFASYCNRKHGVAVSSDTAAFEIQLRIVGVQGLPVLFPALGFPSIIQSIHNAGGEPWFLDTALDGNLFCHVEEVERQILECERAIGEVPAALILMHTGGLLARDQWEIEELCAHYGIPLLEDAAHAFGATLNGEPAGKVGLASAFSLYATKPMHAVEGGMLVTDDDWFADEARTYRNYGRVSNFGRSVCTRNGSSWRITELQSVVGLAKLTEIDAEISTRRWIMQRYDEEQAQRGGVWEYLEPLPISNGLKPNGYRYIMMLPEGYDESDRQRLKANLWKRQGVDLPGEVYELPAQHQPVWSHIYGEVETPIATDFCSRHFSLPVYPDLDNDDLIFIMDAVTEELEQIL